MKKSFELRLASGVPPDQLTSIDLGFLFIGNLYVLLILVAFLIYLNRLANMTKRRKWLWRALLFFGHVFTIPIFWYIHIWKPEHTGPSRSAQ